LATNPIHIIPYIIIIKVVAPPRTIVIIIFTYIVYIIAISIVVVTVIVVTQIGEIIVPILIVRVRQVIRNKPTTDLTKIRTTVTAFHTVKVATTANSTPIPTIFTKFIIIDMYIA